MKTLSPFSAHPYSVQANATGARRRTFSFSRLRRSLVTSAGVLGILGSGAALAQDYPSRPIRLIIPFAAGGAADNVARMVAEPLSKRLKQSVIIDNRAGASGIVGTQIAGRSAPDGYTLIVGTQSTHGLNPFFAKGVGLDPVKAFKPVTMLTTYTNVLVVAANSPYQTVEQLMEKARNAPGELSFGTSGLGSSQYLAGQMFQSAAGVKFLHIPYKGGAAAVTDVIGGQVTMAFDTISTARPLILDKRLRALGVTSAKPSPSLPGVRPISELGLPGYSMESFLAVFAPAGTPDDVVTLLHGHLAEVVALPEVQEKMRLAGMEPSGKGPSELGAQLKADIDKWAAIVREFNISPQ